MNLKITIERDGKAVAFEVDEAVAELRAFTNGGEVHSCANQPSSV